jgi:molybdate transport system substrate-binding protein
MIFTVISFTRAATFLGRAASTSVLAMSAAAFANEPAFDIFAAGSLREAMSALESAYRAEMKQEGRGDASFAPKYLFGPSGRLRERIEGGATPALFVSAAPTHTERLLAAGRLRSSNVFAGNALCVMARPGFSLANRNVVDVLMADDVTVGTSTPGADPSGDYTWEMFRKIDAASPGAFAKLDAKAKKLTGADVNANESQSPYARILVDQRADVFVSYCTNAKSAQTVNPAITFVEVPAQFNVISNYSIGIAPNAPEAAREFLRFILSERAKPALATLGFTAPQARCQSVPPVVRAAHDAWNLPPISLSSNTVLQRAPEMKIGVRHRLQLLPSSALAVAHVAKSASDVRRQNAGAVQFQFASKTHLEVFTDRRAWIDVIRVRDGRVLESIRSERWLGCAGVNKNLGFAVDANEAYRIEVSEIDGNTIDVLAIPITLGSGAK